MTAPIQCSSPDSSQATVDKLVPQLFGPGQGRRGTAQGFSNRMVQARRNGDRATELAYADSLVNYALQNYYAGNLIGGQSTSTQQNLLTFIYAIYCASQISPIPDLSGIFGANTVLIRNITPTIVVTSPDNKAGVKIVQGDVPSTVDGQPFFGTFVSVVKTTNPLPTSLDWYGLDGYKQGAFEFVANPPVNFTEPVLTGVCITYDTDIVPSASDLRLAHRVAPDYVTAIPGNVVLTTPGGTVEITAPASIAPLGLSCDPLTVASNTLGRLLDQLANLTLPSKLLADVIFGGGVGGQAGSFSPFGAVDTRLTATGAGPTSPQYIPVGSTSITSPVSVTVKTRHPSGLTPIPGIAVAFGPSNFAPASALTGANGSAAATWTLVTGTNTGTGTPSQAPLTFAGSPVQFSVTAIQLVPVTISINPAPPNGALGVSYSPFTFAATGGSGAASWSLVGGALPGGLSLSSAGVLSGTPTAVGSFTFTVRATSGSGGSQVTGDAQFTIVVSLPPTTAIGLTFDVGASKTACYALNVPMTPGIRVRVVDQLGNLLTGVPVSIVAVTNNGSKVEVTPSSAVSSGGYAAFGGPTINKTGGYSLIVSTGAPWPVSSLTSGKFNISPSC